MAKGIRSNPVVIRPDTNIGNISAEADDEFLFNCFVDHPALTSAKDLQSKKTFISARTGAGKTAIIRMIERQNPNCSMIDLPDLSMDYVANSDIIRFLKSLDIDLDLFFQALWKHVLCIEFIRMRYRIETEATSRELFSRIRNFFHKDDRRKSALKYLSEWEGKFFITMDENVKEITGKLENKVNFDLGGEIAKFTSRAGYTRSLSTEKKSEIVARAKRIVNSEQLAELNRVLDLLSSFDGEKKYSNEFYILIDRLDEKWVDEEIRYSLIRALIECLKSFNKISNLKVVVAMREDVLERVIQETRDTGFQREKYDDYFLRIRWNKDQLQSLVQKRINSLYKRKYTSDNVFFSDVFKSKVSNKDPFDYIIERTLYRPRDVISFINLCFERAQGSTEITARIVKEAESEYSRVRLQALVQEWQTAFPSLAIAFRLLSNRRGRFTSAEIATKEFLDDFVLEADTLAASENDPIKRAASRYMKEGTPDAILAAARSLISEMYRIGAVGLKTSAGERYIYSFQDVPVVNPEAIDVETKIHIHPMLHRALNVAQDGTGRFF
ncbi:P-loop ATPase, Sll1717 family [Aureimonas ureilytica]|uniref:P-loop ATPase, Sll1717 family n=1 Tax=Aureimonas ureilytica TaxID=401562 RepID=UPI000AAE31CA|nr:DNA repair ATPase [Aureimonas ureilytica]